jgi:hypothetical protein
VATVESGAVPPSSRRPHQAEPSAAAQQAKAVARKRSDVARVGFTTTSDGRWALKVWLRNGAHPPLHDVESAAGAEVPVVYDSEPDRPTVARPAFPVLGE